LLVGDFKPRADGDLLPADRIAYRSSWFPDVSIKKLFSLPGPSQESGARPARWLPATDVSMIMLSPEPTVIDMRHGLYLHVCHDRS
jgi:hypothetical protein